MTTNSSSISREFNFSHIFKDLNRLFILQLYVLPPFNSTHPTILRSNTIRILSFELIIEIKFKIKMLELVPTCE